MIFKMNTGRFNVLSSGGGTQSNATICLIHAGVLPKPDVIVMSDTEREMPNVFEYQEKYIKPLCEDMGVKYHIVKKSDYTEIDLYSTKGKVLPPFFTEWNGRLEDESCSKQPSFCSTEWKTRIVHRFLNEHYSSEVKRGVDQWIGYTVDEMHRCRFPIGKWQKRYPLIELRMNRQNAIRSVEKYALPTPPRSACWMCPNRTNHEWDDMKHNQPETFKQACDFEKKLQEEHPHLWLHQKGIPLDKVIFTDDRNQIDMFGHCHGGECYT